MMTRQLKAMAVAFALAIIGGGAVQAVVDTEALPDVEEGFEIVFFVKEPHIINPSALCFDKQYCCHLLPLEDSRSSNNPHCMFYNSATAFCLSSNLYHTSMDRHAHLFPSDFVFDHNMLRRIPSRLHSAYAYLPPT